MCISRCHSNRSHYEDVLVVRVHDFVPKEVWRRRYDQINAFERMLAEEDATIVKFFLHISREEQKERLEARLAEPDKLWKFNPGISTSAPVGTTTWPLTKTYQQDHVLGAVVSGAGRPQVVSRPCGGGRPG